MLFFLGGGGGGLAATYQEIGHQDGKQDHKQCPHWEGQVFVGHVICVIVLLVKCVVFKLPHHHDHNLGNRPVWIGELQPLGTRTIVWIKYM